MCVIPSSCINTFKPISHQGQRAGQVIGCGDLGGRWTPAPQHREIHVRINHKMERKFETLVSTGDQSDIKLVKQQLRGRCAEMKKAVMLLPFCP